MTDLPLPLSLEPQPSMSGQAPPERPKSSLEMALAAAERGSAPATEAFEADVNLSPQGFSSVLDEALAEPAQQEQPIQPQGWSNDDIKDAVTALKRLGVPESVIRANAEQDLDTLVNWGLSVHEDRSTRDDDFRRSRETEREIGAPVEPTLAPSFALSAKLKAKLNELEPGSGDELEATMQATNAAGVRQALIAENSALELTRSQLAREWPALANERQYERVKQCMKQIVGSRQFSSYSDLMRRAAQIELGQGAKAAPTPERSRDLTMRRAGQVSTRVRSGAAQKKFGMESLLDSVIAAQSRGIKGDALKATADSLRSHVDTSIRPKKPSWMNLPH